MIEDGSDDAERFGELVDVLLDSELPFKEDALGEGEWQVSSSCLPLLSSVLKSGISPSTQFCGHSFPISMILYPTLERKCFLHLKKRSYKLPPGAAYFLHVERHAMSNIACALFITVRWETANTPMQLQSWQFLQPSVTQL